MKKFVSVFLCIALLAGLVTAFSVGTAADDGTPYPAPLQDGRYQIDWYKENGKYPKKDGVYFGGWYEDEACTIPFMEKSGLAYAKFVDQNVFKLAFQVRGSTTKESERTDLRVITTVDSLDYQYIRFYVYSTFWVFDNPPDVSVQITTVYNRLFGMDGKTVMTYTPNMFSASSKYFAVLTLKNVKLSVPLEFTLGWMTADGTYVELPATPFRYVYEFVK